MLASHPGLQALEEAGVCQGRTLDPDVQEWLLTLGRCDIEVSIMVTRPAERAERLSGPPEIFRPPADPLKEPLAAAEALRAWRAHQPADRTAVLCRRAGQWVVAARVWQDGEEPIDEVTVSPLEGDTTMTQAVADILGEELPAEFEGINIEAERLQTVLSNWQADPQGHDVIGELLKLGLTARQARMVVAVSDVGAVRASIGAVQYSLDGPAFAGVRCDGGRHPHGSGGHLLEYRRGPAALDDAVPRHGGPYRTRRQRRPAGTAQRHWMAAPRKNSAISRTLMCLTSWTIEFCGW